MNNIDNCYQVTDWITHCIPMDISRDEIYFQRSFMVNRKVEEINLTIELKNRKKIILETE